MGRRIIKFQMVDPAGLPSGSGIKLKKCFIFVYATEATKDEGNHLQ